jgi:hypothetical protein
VTIVFPRIPAPEENFNWKLVRDNEAQFRQIVERVLRQLSSLATSEDVAAAIGAIPTKEPARATTILTTASLAAGVEGTGTIDFDNTSTALLKIAADRACRVRLYATAAARTADSARATTVDPLAGIGVLGEFVFGSATTIPVSPMVWLYNGDAPAVELIYYAVVNKTAGTSTVQVTFTHVKQEELP